MDQAAKPRIETEIKLRLADASSGKRKLRQAGFHVSKRRVLETNVLFDTADGRLRRDKKIVRLRRCGSKWLATFKGPGGKGDRYKVREEVETGLADGAALERILVEAGLRASYFYEKYRTEYRRPGERGCAMLDETPAGVFLELEGSPGWIDRTARRMGYGPSEYITESYATIWRREGKGKQGMRFS